MPRWLERVKQRQKLIDVVARLVGPHLERSLGQPVIVDNRPAASGIVGTEATAKAAPDGHTLLMVASSFTVILLDFILSGIGLFVFQGGA